MNRDRLRSLAEQILEEVSEQDPPSARQLLARELRKLTPQIPAGPWYLSEVQEAPEGCEFITLGARPAPHYEDTIAEFHVGDLTDAPAQLMCLVGSHLEMIIEALENPAS